MKPSARIGIIKQYLSNATVVVDGTPIYLPLVKNYTESILDDISMILRGHSVTITKRKQP